jgi:hypothetical protein
MDDKPDKNSAEDERLRQRREELEEELEMYAQSGVSSPGLLKAARWVSRGLYFAMAGLVVFLLFSGWGKISQHDFESVQQALEQQTKKLSEVRTERDDFARKFMQAETELRLARMEQQHAQSPHAEADKALAAAARALDPDDVLSGWAWAWRTEARPKAELLAELEEKFPGADEQTRVEILALLASADNEGQGRLMTAVATAPERPVVQRIIAVRWLAGRKEDMDTRRVLEALAQGEGPVANEARQHVE